MTTISPMLAQKLNNNQKTSTTTSNYNQVSTKSMPSDKFVKSNKMRAVLPESYSALYIKCTVRLLRIAKKNALFNVRFCLP